MKKMTLLGIAALFTTFAFSQTEDEKAQKAILTTLEKGWNSKNGETFASVFADVHSYIVVNGFYFPEFTKQMNGMAHQGLFDGVYKTRDIKLKVDKITPLTTTLAYMTALGVGYDKGGEVPADPGIIMTLLLEKQDDGWKIIAFHNHNLTSFEEKERSPVPLNVMYASWYE